MCIYCGTTKYRKIYENHFGKIPTDLTGRVYDIHHVDGDHSNNHFSNLIAVTIAEHYQIHYDQGDFGACFMMSKRMNISPEDLSLLAKLNFDKRIKDGTHPFVTGLQQNRIKNGTHNLVGDKNPAHKMVANGTHPWQSKEHAEKSRNRLMIAHTCPHCLKKGNGISMFRYHFDHRKSKLT